MSRVPTTIAVIWSIATLFSGTVGAQPVALERFMPLSIGNQWEYRFVVSQNAEETEGYDLFEVAGDTVLNGSDYYRLEGLRVDNLFREISRWTCFVRLGDDATAAYALFENGCLAYTPFPGVRPGDLSYVQTVQVGSHDYDVAATAYYSSFASGPGGQGGGTTIKWASDIGVVQHLAFSTGRQFPVQESSSSRTSELTYARVDERTFGTSVRSALIPTDWAEFSPLRPGDRWLYRTEVSVQTEAPPPPRLEFEVLADSIRAGEVWHVMVARIPSGEGEPADQATYLFRQDSRGLVSRIEPLAQAPITNAIPLLSWSFFSATTSNPQFIVTSFAHRVELGPELAGPRPISEYVGDLKETDGSIHHDRRLHAAGIGTVAHTVTTSGGGKWEARLIAARVGGVDFGEWNEAVESARQLPLLYAYPNPFQGEIHLQLGGSGADALRVELFDLVGRRVLRRELGFGGWLATLSLPDLPAGAYILRLTAADGRMTSRVVFRM